jgi:long-chain acyl-CoA synthetase
MYRAIVQRLEAEGRLELFQRGLRVVELAKRRAGVNLGRWVFRELHQRLGGHLRFMVSGGAALNPQTALQYFKLGLPLLQGWGLTEAAPVVAVQRWDPRKFLFSNYYEEHVGSVGQPVDGVEVRLIDVPEKEIYVNLHGEGELVIRGPNIFPGYWQAEEETRAAKIGEWFRTGDLGRIDEEGNIWITGRAKYVIVLDSGEKVVPDEVEDELAASSLIEDVCVVPRQVRGKTQVGAVVYPNREVAQQRLQERGSELSERAVQELVQEEVNETCKRLAQYKRVAEVVLTDTPLPKTALRKIARGQLPDSFSFDLKRWEMTFQELLQASVVGAADTASAEPSADGAAPASD